MFLDHYERIDDRFFILDEEFRKLDEDAISTVKVFIYQILNLFRCSKDGDKVVGFAVYSPSRDEDLPDAGEVDAIYVLSE